jgi:GNAT superfamily N-acetyltransferase
LSALTLRHPGGYELSTERERLDLDTVHGWLSTDSYWAAGRSREAVERSAAGSVCFGLYRVDDGRQVAFARVVTDGATFGWVCDVYVDRGERGHGLGRWLVGAARDHLHSLGVRRLILATRDAHGVYAKLGFAPMGDATQWMELDTRSSVEG